jgi:hypothetical protein
MRSGRLVVSDGLLYMSAVFAVQLNGLVTTNQVAKDSLITIKVCGAGWGRWRSPG